MKQPADWCCAVVDRTRPGFAGQIRRGGAFCLFADARWDFMAGRQGSVKGTVLLRKIRYGLIAVSPGLLRKLFWRVTFAWRGKSHQNRADRTRILRRNYTGMGLTEILHSPSLILGPV